MNSIKYLLISLTFLMVSCKKYEPVSPYVYETNPHYNWGFSEYFGAYYKDYGIDNNVFSISLFSDSLDINEDGNLTGFGQYLFLEDVFVNTTATQLLSGTYTISDSGEPFTVAPGVLDTIDNEVYNLGAMIYYFEENNAKSTLKMISEGSFTVSRTLTDYSIVCDFKTSDGKELKGSFTGPLENIDESIDNEIERIKKRLKYYQP